MLQLDTIDSAVSDLSEIYRIEAQRMQVVALSELFSARTSNDLVKRDVITRSYKKNALDTLSGAAVYSTIQLLDGDFSEMARNAKNDIADIIDRQMNLDLAQIKGKLRRAALYLNSSDMSAKSRAKIARASNLEDPLTAFDVSGRKREAGSYIELHIRHALITLYNDAIVTSAMSDDIDHGYVESEDESHRFNGEKFTFDQYENFRKKAFHPNSRAIVTIHV